MTGSQKKLIMAEQGKWMRVFNAIHDIIDQLKRLGTEAGGVRVVDLTLGQVEEEVIIKLDELKEKLNG